MTEYVDFSQLRRELNESADAVTNHVAWCDHCDVGAPKKPDWIAGLCPVGNSIATDWRRKEAAYLGEVFKLDVDGEAGGADRG